MESGSLGLEGSVALSSSDLTSDDSVSSKS